MTIIHTMIGNGKKYSLEMGLLMGLKGSRAVKLILLWSDFCWHSCRLSGHWVLASQRHKRFILPELHLIATGGTQSRLSVFVLRNHLLTSCHHPHTQGITHLQHTAQNTGDLNPPVEHPVKNCFRFPSILGVPSARNRIKVKLCHGCCLH